jgi:hypothetical protein
LSEAAIGTASATKTLASRISLTSARPAEERVPLPLTLRPDFGDGITGLETASGLDGAPKSIESFESRFPLHRWLRDLSQGILKEIVDLFGNGVLPLSGEAGHCFVLIVVEE